MTEWLSTWGITRAAGLTSYLLLFFSVLFGTFYYGRLLPNRIRAYLQPLHQITGWTGFLFGLVHGIVLYIDSFQTFQLKGILIPFTAEYKPILSGLGTITLYLYLILLATSDFIRPLSKRVWRALHYLAFPAFFIGWTHGLLMGTDSQEGWIRLFYAATLLIVVVAVLIRILIHMRMAEESEQTKSRSPGRSRQ